MDSGMSKAMDATALIREYLLLGLRFDRVEEGYVDSFTGDPALRRLVESEPKPDPADLDHGAVGAERGDQTMHARNHRASSLAIGRRADLVPATAVRLATG